MTKYGSKKRGGNWWLAAAAALCLAAAPWTAPITAAAAEAGAQQTEQTYSRPWTYDDEKAGGTDAAAGKLNLATPDTPIVSSRPHPAPGRPRRRPAPRPRTERGGQAERPAGPTAASAPDATAPAAAAPAAPDVAAPAAAAPEPAEDALAPADAQSRPWVKGKALQPGDTIGIIAPASPLDGDLEPYLEVLHQLGYQTKLAPHARAVDGYLAGTDEERAQDINDFFADDTVQALLCLRGGYGSARTLDLLDYEAIRWHPKLLLGFSDVTALQTALGSRSGLVTVSSPFLSQLRAGASYSLDLFRQGVATNQPLGKLSLPAGRKLETLQSGSARGRLAGGNLSVLSSLVGTPYGLDGTDAILVLEEVGEAPYRVDRMLNQLYQSGLLHRVAAICYGDFVNCPAGPDGVTVDDVLLHYAVLSGKPAIKGLPVGHGGDNAFVPYGVLATLQANDDGTASLTVTESHAR